MSSLRSTLSLAQASYIVIVAVTALVAFLPSDPNGLVYVALLALPMSIFVAPLMFVVVGFTFADSGSLWLPFLDTAVWTAIAIVHAVMLRLILDALRERRRSALG